MRRLGIAAICIAFLLVAGSSVWSAEIHDVAAKGDIVKVKALVERKPELLNLADKDGATPLHHAVAKNQKAVVLWLIERKANVNVRKNDGVTPLHIAASLGYKDIVELLLNAKTDKNLVDKKGRTPLSLAQAGKHQAVVNLLLPGKAATALQVPPVPQANDLDSITREIVSDLTAGNYTKVVGRFDQTMKSALPEPALKNAYAIVVSQFGSFNKLLNVHSVKVRGYDVVSATCEFAKAKVDIQVSYDAAKQVNGFYMLKSQAR